MLTVLPALSAASGPVVCDAQRQSNTTIHLRWGQQRNASRYRLQLARDRDFADVVFDRIVRGNEIFINELSAGRYFWRVAPIGNQVGQFSSAGVVEVADDVPRANASPTPATPGPTNETGIVTSDGWRAAIGNVLALVPAHLRSRNRLDVVAANANGITYALDAMSGVALWSVRAPAPQNGASTASPVIVSARSQLDNIVVFSGTAAAALDGATGRVLWRTDLPSSAASATVLSDNSGLNIIVIDDSLRRLFVLDSHDGRIVSEIALPGRAIGPPASFNDRGRSAFALAYENGQVEIRDKSGSLIRSGSVLSSATTPPLLVHTAHGNLILVGTRDGLTALDAETLRPLGRVALNHDTPSGSLIAQDLDGDGVAEVIMNTVRGHVVAINAGDGKILWDVEASTNSNSFAFADVNGDGTLDIFTTDAQGSLVALSARNGAQVWKEPAFATPIVLNPNPFGRHSLVSLPTGSGVVIIGADPSGTGVRAVNFTNARVRPTSR